MTDYEKELQKAYDEGLDVKEKALKSDAFALIKGNRIALNTNKLTTTKEKACALTEERAHHHLTVGNILDQSVTANRKQEYKTRLQAYNERIGLLGLVRAYEHGCHSWDEAAEYLDVPTKYLVEVVDCYRKKYGKYTTVDNYVVSFIPTLGVARLF